MEKLSPKLMSWASILEPSTRDQAVMTATMPFIRPHLALMPDAHLGLGATVGSVIPTVRAIMPAAVGVDIGCGMLAVRTQFTREQLPPYAAVLREAIEAAVPLSAGSYNQAVTRDHTRTRLAQLEELAAEAEFDPASYVGHWRLQLGTLGSGNHFIELTVDEQDRVSSCTRVRGASGTRSPNGTSRWPKSCARSGGSSCRTRTLPTSSRARTSSGPTSGRCGGHRTSPGSTAKR